MAATKTDPFAAKQAKQKKILIGLSIVLVAVLAIQLPRIMGGGSATSAAAPTEGTAATPGGNVVADATATAAAASAASATPAYGATAPPTLAASSTPQADKAQLASFSLFETKDPFVQQIVEQPAGAAAAAPAGGGAKTAAAGGITTGGSGTGSAPGKMTNATISVNGDPQALALEDTFPEGDPMFVLAGLKPKQARIGIAGGSLKDGKTVALQLGKKLTLVDTATGARYTLELLYVGTAPEETAEFTGEPQQTQQTQPTP